MSTQVWVAGAIRFLSFPGIANVVLTGCDTGDVKKARGKSIARPALF
jgi:hypothetical protein